MEHLEVGGDWHDAFALPDGRLGIAVGDVVGRGARRGERDGAAAQRRAGARGRRQIGPAEVLGHLDTFVEQVAAARYATVRLRRGRPCDRRGLLRLGRATSR